MDSGPGGFLVSVPMLSPISMRFDQARLKVERANHHIKEMSVQIAAFTKVDFHSLRAGRDPNSGQYQLKLHTTASFPINAALIIGDVAHNLSSALDYMATAVAGADDHRVDFPVEETRDRLEKSSSYRTIQKARPDIASAILNMIQPYEGGRHPVRAIRRLYNIDKHKLLIPHFQVTGLTGVSLESEGNDPANRLVVTNLSMLIEDDLVLNAIGYPLPMKITNKGHASFSVVFGKGGPFEGRSVIPTLVQLRNTVLYVIQVLEPVFFKRADLKTAI